MSQPGDKFVLPALSVGECFTLATIMEVTAPKPGNIHRGADFEDASYPDFIVAATLVGPIMQRAVELPLGQTVLASARATRAAVENNTNLGTVLLCAPLAKVPRTISLAEGIGDVLANLSPQDARDVYEAIRVAAPGGLGKVEEADVADAPPEDLIAAMRMAADRDLVARQYANGYREVFGEVVPRLQRALGEGLPISEAIVLVQLQLMSEFPDSLIARKLGAAVARESADRAARVLQLGRPGEESYDWALADFDFWLRGLGHLRNPGTTADLIAAGLFAALRDGIIKLPFRLARLD